MSHVPIYLSAVHMYQTSYNLDAEKKRKSGEMKTNNFMPYPTAHENPSPFLVRILSTSKKHILPQNLCPSRMSQVGHRKAKKKIELNFPIISCSQCVRASAVASESREIWEGLLHPFTYIQFVHRQNSGGLWEAFQKESETLTCNARRTRKKKHSNEPPQRKWIAQLE